LNPALSVFDLLRGADGGASWLLNFQRCVKIGFMHARTQAILEQERDRLQSANAGAAAILDRMRELLPSAWGTHGHDDLCQCFCAAYPEPFAVLKVLTRDTYENYYTEKPGDQPKGRTSRLQAPLDNRDPEYMPPAQAERAGPGFEQPPLRPRITLAPADGLAFVTDFEGWQARSEMAAAAAIGADGGTSAMADTAMLWLGLNYSTGTRLVAMVVQEGLDLTAAGCRRPTLLDAGTHPWWLCWPDDPPDLGHTVDLAHIASTPARRGAREWVMNPVQISTDFGAVQAQHLGHTTIDTLGSNEVMRRQFDAAAQGTAL